MKKTIVFAMILSLLCAAPAFAATKKADPTAACEKLAAKKHIPEDKKADYVNKCVKKRQAKK
ncbi:MAG TPA: hypothetical protein PKB11_11450 [Desulfovibrio sp.]|jgi:hypothetical protein|uniref:hypothetical protein n=1 Tax=Desulfovibrio TaxID=872 RepID=UPI0004276B9E|nr:MULTISPECIES: hypothetical protein [Desulfovibrio]MDY0307113.1 hypothetical protein [Desulfovibrionaceae bacterium]HMM39361.1 hypothetical protein [Desulfovibrio sp.]